MKKKRGRPKKVREEGDTLNKDETIIKEEQSEVSNKELTTPEAAVDVAPIEKKKRGRPRKVVAEDDEKSNDTKAVKEAIGEEIAEVDKKPKSPLRPGGDLPEGWTRRCNVRESGVMDFYLKTNTGEILR